MSTMELVREYSDGRLRLRWIEWFDDPDGVALLVGDLTKDRWVLSAAHAREGEHHFARGVEDTTSAPEQVERCLLAFGVPWCRVTPDLLAAQADQLLGCDPGVLAELAEIPVDELDALRAVVGDMPEDMTYALGARRACREAAGDSTRGPSWS